MSRAVVYDGQHSESGTMLPRELGDGHVVYLVCETRLGRERYRVVHQDQRSAEHRSGAGICGYREFVII